MPSIPNKFSPKDPILIQGDEGPMPEKYKTPALVIPGPGSTGNQNVTEKWSSPAGFGIRQDDAIALVQGGASVPNPPSHLREVV